MSVIAGKMAFRVPLAAATVDAGALHERDGGQPVQNHARFRTGGPPRGCSSLPYLTWRTPVAHGIEPLWDYSCKSIRAGGDFSLRNGL